MQMNTAIDKWRWHSHKNSFMSFITLILIELQDVANKNTGCPVI